MNLKEKLWEEVSYKMNPSDYDGSIEFAVRHGLIDSAVYEWCSTGASEYEFKRCPVSLAQFKKSSDKLLKLADTFTCKQCNHVGFYDKGEYESINWCYSCGSKEVINKD